MKRYIPLSILAFILGLSIYFDLHHFFSFEHLQHHKEYLAQWIDDNFLAAVVLFSLVYTLSVAASVPGATFLTVSGGFLFGALVASIIVVFSATVGATLLFLAVQTAFGKKLAEKASGWVKKMEEGFCEDAFYYLLVLRLVPLFPFWIVNIVPALLGVRLRTFVLATFIGIIPGSVVYVLVGNGLGAVIDQGRKPDLMTIFQPEILVPLIGLACLSLVPVIYKHLNRRSS